MKFFNLIKVAACLPLLFSALTFAAAPKSGEMAPNFSLKGSDGKVYKLSEFKGKTVVLEWFNKDCPYVRKFYDSKTMQTLQQQLTGRGTIWFSIVSSAPGKEGFLSPAAANKLKSVKAMANTAILLDDKSEVAKLYVAKTTPHMFIIDKTGKIAYQGAIDDQPSANPETLKKANNYVAEAFKSLENGEPVKESSTPPYGCSVKY